MVEATKPVDIDVYKSMLRVAFHKLQWDGVGDEERLFPSGRNEFIRDDIQETLLEQSVLRNQEVMDELLSQFKAKTGWSDNRIAVLKDMIAQQEIALDLESEAIGILTTGFLAQFKEVLSTGDGRMNISRIMNTVFRNVRSDLKK